LVNKIKDLRGLEPYHWHETIITRPDLVGTISSGSGRTAGTMPFGILK